MNPSSDPRHRNQKVDGREKSKGFRFLGLVIKNRPIRKTGFYHNGHVDN